MENENGKNIHQEKSESTRQKNYSARKKETQEKGASVRKKHWRNVTVRERTTRGM
jgi:hypothetical protein